MDCKHKLLRTSRGGLQTPKKVHGGITNHLRAATQKEQAIKKIPKRVPRCKGTIKFPSRVLFVLFKTNTGTLKYLHAILLHKLYLNHIEAI